MNILFVTPAPPFPPTDGARLMIVNLARVLATRHTLCLLALTEPSTEISAAPYFTTTNYVPLSIAPRWKKWGYSLFDTLPLWSRVCASEALRARLPAMIARQAIDVVHLDTGMMAQYADELTNVPTVLAPHDSLTAQLQDRAQHAARFWMRMLMRVQAKKMRAYEAAYYRRATRVCVVTPREREFLETLAPGLDARVIPNGVDLDYFAPQASLPAPNSIGFLGGMDYAPNESAALYFVNEILPRVWAEIPDATCALIGRNPTRAINALAHDARVRVTGTVADVRPHVAAQSVMVAPILSAGGMKFKVLETLALGKAVVATPEAIQGLTVQSESQLLVARGASEFSQACVRLLRDKTLCARLEKNARAWALGHAWKNTAAQYEQLYREARDAFAVRRT